MGRDVEWLPAPGAMPFVDVELKLVASREQHLVDGNELVEQRGETGPEARGVQCESGREILFDQLHQPYGHPQSVALAVVSIHCSPGQWQALAVRGQRLLREQIVVAS